MDMHWALNDNDPLTMIGVEGVVIGKGRGAGWGHAWSVDLGSWRQSCLGDCIQDPGSRRGRGRCLYETVRQAGRRDMGGGGGMGAEMGGVTKPGLKFWVQRCGCRDAGTVMRVQRCGWVCGVQGRTWGSCGTVMAWRSTTQKNVSGTGGGGRGEGVDEGGCKGGVRERDEGAGGVGVGAWGGPGEGKCGGGGGRGRGCW